MGWIGYLHFDWANILYSLSFTSLHLCVCVCVDVFFFSLFTSLFFSFFFVENDWKRSRHLYQGYIDHQIENADKWNASNANTSFIPTCWCDETRRVWIFTSKTISTYETWNNLGSSMNDARAFFPPAKCYIGICKFSNCKEWIIFHVECFSNLCTVTKFISIIVSPVQHFTKVIPLNSNRINNTRIKEWNENGTEKKNGFSIVFCCICPYRPCHCFECSSSQHWLDIVNLSLKSMLQMRNNRMSPNTNRSHQSKMVILFRQCTQKFSIASITSLRYTDRRKKNNHKTKTELIIIIITIMRIIWKICAWRLTTYSCLLQNYQRKQNLWRNFRFI